ncbi:PaiB family negative transcriptional regulator [Lacibacter cauensis]|uniref:PaiB family negative transcriptional regulator n=1 Tax=Lacibacter cauensis TaxID=510947 RepID=A0A562SXB5_9BACT|nr:FMN-binding negative transcriptional regulator [Lacibacter cauensis]TWI85803.1 PaiB family negative transcriptional regulator [Lacibacter cauensis]
MYIPKHFSVDDSNQILSFIKQYSFASIISLQDKLPVAAHLPFIVEEEDGHWKLLSHFAKLNQQWEAIENQISLVIFSEPHAYISPVHYTSALNVPTWNYVAVHVYGEVQIIREQKRVEELLMKTIQHFEPGYLQQWNGLPDKFKLNMQNGIVAFEMHITQVQAKFKLSQNRTEVERKAISTALKFSEKSVEKELGMLMKHNENH